MAENDTRLTAAELPDVTNPLPFSAWAGDHSDDDGRAIDDMFEAAYAGPVETEEPPAGKKEVKTTTRLLSRTVTLPAGVYVQLLPPDVNRVGLTVYATTGAVIQIADDPGTLPMSGMLTTAPIALDAHTGSLWVKNIHATDPAIVSAIAITS